MKTDVQNIFYQIHFNLKFEFYRYKQQKIGKQNTSLAQMLKQLNCKFGNLNLTPD